MRFVKCGEAGVGRLHENFIVGLRCPVNTPDQTNNSFITFSSNARIMFAIVTLMSMFSAPSAWDVDVERRELMQVISRNKNQQAPKPTLIHGSQINGIIQERWDVEVEDGPQGLVPLLLAKQAGVVQNKLPVVMFLHGTGGSKETFQPQLAEYARAGYLALALDTRYHGERRQSGLGEYHRALVRAWESGEEMPFIFDSTFDIVRVIDYLCTRPDADCARIGVTGVSLGGMHAWFAAAVDERVRAAAPLIGVQGFAFALKDPSTNLWQARVDSLRPVFDRATADLTGGSGGETEAGVVAAVWDRIAPGLRDRFDAPRSLRLVAPRPLLVLNGELDPRCPLQGVQEAVAEASAEYRKHSKHAASNEGAGAGGGDTYGERLGLFVAPGAGHEATPSMWAAVDAFFALHLLGPSRANAEL
jgi:dienelactone hydrolase